MECEWRAVPLKKRSMPFSVPLHFLTSQNTNAVVGREEPSQTTEWKLAIEDSRAATQKAWGPDDVELPHLPWAVSLAVKKLIDCFLEQFQACRKIGKRVESCRIESLTPHP